MTNFMNEKEIYDLKMEATFDDAEAQLKLGSYYLLNNNISEGIHWIKAASQQELPQAIHLLAEIYETGIYIQENKKFWSKEDGWKIDKNGILLKPKKNIGKQVCN